MIAIFTLIILSIFAMWAFRKFVPETKTTTTGILIFLGALLFLFLVGYQTGTPMEKKELLELLPNLPFMLVTFGVVLLVVFLPFFVLWWLIKFLYYGSKNAKREWEKRDKGD